MDPRRKPNLDFFQRLQELRDTGLANLHHIKPSSGKAMMEAASRAVAKTGSEAKANDHHEKPKRRAQKGRLARVHVDAEGASTPSQDPSELMSRKQVARKHKLIREDRHWAVQTAPGNDTGAGNGTGARNDTSAGNGMG